jgi:2-C-methyl-D-erythritol 4-phosphate cytidylyltransferase
VARFTVILAAAARAAGIAMPVSKKPFAPLADRPVWLHSAERFVNRDDVKQVIVIFSPEEMKRSSEFAANVAILGNEVVEAATVLRR